jgi:hypothetical protein
MVAKSPLDKAAKVVNAVKSKAGSVKKMVGDTISAAKSKTKLVKRAVNASMHGVKSKASAVKSAVKNASMKVANKASRLSGIKKLEHDIKKVNDAHDFLVDYYHNTEFDDIHYGAFGAIDLKKIDKSKHEKLFAKLSSKKYDKSHVKDAFRILKIKSADVRGKTHDQIIKTISKEIKSLHLMLKNKIEEVKERQKLKVAHYRRKNEIRNERKMSNRAIGFKTEFNPS